MQFIHKLRRQYSLSIRAKLLLVSLSLLIVPVIGYKYIQEMEAYLRDDQEKSLIENARIVAAVLHGYKNIFSKQDVSTVATTEAALPNHLYVRPLKSAPQMDGYAEDWLYYRV